MSLFDMLESKVKEELDHFRLITHDNPTLSNLLYTHQLLRSHIRGLKEVVRFVEGQAKCPANDGIKRNNEEDNRCAETLESIIGDYRAVLTRAEDLAAECSTGMTIVAHNASTLEAEKAIAEAQAVTKLTKLAVIFVPLSFVTSVFSMNVKELNTADGGPPVWSWAMTSVVTGVLTFGFFWWSEHVRFHVIKRLISPGWTGNPISGRGSIKRVEPPV